MKSPHLEDSQKLGSNTCQTSLRTVVRFDGVIDPSVLNDSLSPNAESPAIEAALEGETAESESEDEDPLLQIGEHEHCREAKKYLKPEVAYLHSRLMHY